MYLLMRGSLLMFYGSKHRGVKIYFVIYLEKIKKQSHIETNCWYQNHAHKLIVYWGVMVFNATSNNISVISWWSVLLVEKTTNLPQVTDKLYHSRIRMLEVIATGCMGSYIYSTTIRSRRSQ